jgi:flagellar protein FlgJ
MSAVNAIGIGNPVNMSGVQASREQQQAGKFNRVLQEAMQSKEDKKLRQACEELESVFVYRLLSAMRASIPRSDFIARGMATETFESMLDEEYAKTISRQGSLGLAAIIYQQLSRQ